MRKFGLVALSASALATMSLVACGESDGGEEPTLEPVEAGDASRADGRTGATDAGGGGDAASGAKFSVGGKVKGLLGGGLKLKNNGGDELAVGQAAADGGVADAGDGGVADAGPADFPFTFATKVASGATFAVTVETQPAGPKQTCTVASGSGTIASADVTNVDVTCATDTFSVGGNVAGLDAGESVELQNNGGPDHAVNANAAFTMPNKVADGQSYTVTVKTPPAGKKCAVTNDSGTIAGANVTSVTVTCVLACGDGVLDASEECDDGNAVDVDACSNACTKNALYSGGNARTFIEGALATLAEPFSAATGGGQWGDAPASGILISSNDGGSELPNTYQAFLDAGGHILMIGGSGASEMTTFVGNFLTTDGTSSWHQASDCVSDWNTVGVHPITQFLPPTYEFANASSSYHMLHFTAVQPAGATVIGDTCHGANPAILATRRYASNGTFTYMALDLGAYDGLNTQAEFVAPFLKGYLAFVRAKP
jgi:cysteine-rich repeat protein